MCPWHDSRSRPLCRWLQRLEIHVRSGSGATGQKLSEFFKIGWPWLETDLFYLMDSWLEALY